MKHDGHFRIGIFVLSALVLLVVLLYYLGMSDLFKRKALLSTFFTESVQGLSVGAQVKYKGATIGNVEKIVILPRQKIILVDMSVELDSFRGGDGRGLFPDADSFYEFLKQEIRAGMRCRLEFAGITGLRYLDFDYFAPPGEPAGGPGVAVSGYLMPSAPSALRDVVKSLNTSMERISKIRFEEISDNLVRNLDDLNKILASDEIRNTITQMSQLSSVLSQTITDDRLLRMADEMERFLSEARMLTESLRKEAETSDIAGTAAALRKSADALSTLLAEQSPEVKNALDAWIRAMEIFRELADNLNRDPASLVRGRR